MPLSGLCGYANNFVAKIICYSVSDSYACFPTNGNACANYDTNAKSACAEILYYKGFVQRAVAAR
jgi:hypothetical protein